jgi:bifunctional non-homologous end joining protein LigD
MARDVGAVGTETDSVREQIERAPNGSAIRVGEYDVVLTDLDRILWPAASGPAVTKRDFLRYLVRVAPVVLPFLRNRPVEVTCCPNGIDGESVFELDGVQLPPFAQTVPVWPAERDRPAPHLLVPDLVTLVWLGERCAVELFPWLSRVGIRPGTSRMAELDGAEPDATAGLWYPDFLVVNLDWRRTVRDEHDPAAMTDDGFRRVADVALDLRSVANALGMRSFVKTSGRRGLHCFLPLDRALNYSEVRVMAEMIGQFLLSVRPRNSTRAMTLLAQSGFISIDHNQNTWGKVLVAPYSPRRHPSATVSTPLDWSELATAGPTEFTIHTVPDLLASRGDPWADLDAGFERIEPAAADGAGNGRPGVEVTRAEIAGAP